MTRWYVLLCDNLGGGSDWTVVNCCPHAITPVRPGRAAIELAHWSISSLTVQKRFHSSLALVPCRTPQVSWNEDCGADSTCFSWSELSRETLLSTTGLYFAEYSCLYYAYTNKLHGQRIGDVLRCKMCYGTLQVIVCFLMLVVLFTLNASRNSVSDSTWSLCFRDYFTTSWILLWIWIKGDYV